MNDGPRCALWGALAAAAGLGTAWGFSVDDALISGRVAQHLWHGHGYRFNLDGPVVDAVTPLGWAHLLAPFAGGGAEQAVQSAATLGALLWVLAAAALGRRVAPLCTGPRRAAFFLCLATCLPLAAWACAGMETGVVLALGVGALAPGLRGALCAGAAAALRPELVPWAVVLSYTQAVAAGAPRRARLAAWAAALLPALVVALLRWAVFGRPAPLAVFAKPSDLEHGLRYAFGVVVLAGPALSLLGWRAWGRVPKLERSYAVAFGVHVLFLICIGGDWMPLWRLAVPALPGVLLAGAALAEASSGWGNAARALLLAAAAAQLHFALGPDARRVRARQAGVIERGRELLVGAERVGSVDVGWLGAATSATVVDFAGVTDPEVAFLRGGHTSKRLPVDFLERRRVDALVLRRQARAPWEGEGEAAGPGSGAGQDLLSALASGARLRWAYAVDARVLGLRGAQRFQPVGTIPLAAGGDYLVLRAARSEP